MRAVAIDPGGTTGYALAELIPSINNFQIAYGQSRMTEEELFHFLEKFGPKFVVCEDFEYRRKSTTVDLTPVKLIGVVSFYCSNQRTKLTMQKAGTVIPGPKKKAYFTNDRLREMELYQRGLQHGRDACRHLLYWATFGQGFKYVGDAQISLVPEEFL